MDAVVNELIEHGIDPPSSWSALIQSALAPSHLDLVDIEHPDLVVAACFSFMDNKLDDVTSIVFAQSLVDVLSRNGKSLKPAFQMAAKSLFITRAVLASRLASRYFHEGRRQVDGSLRVGAGRWLLERCVEVTQLYVEPNWKASDNSKRLAASQVATASAHIARLSPHDSIERRKTLELGLDHSVAAAELGDHSPDHDGYALELALRLHELGDLGALDRVSTALDRIDQSRSANLQGLIGDVAFGRAASLIVRRDVAHALPLLAAAIERYTTALTYSPDSGVDLGYLVAKRGRAHYLLYQRGHDSLGRRDTPELALAINDWTDPRAQPHRHDRELAALFLSRARLALARSDTAGGVADVASADALLANDPDERTQQALSSQAVAASLEAGMDSDSVKTVISSLEDAASLSVAAPCPSGTMARVTQWLRGRVLQEEWVALAEAVLDRLDADIAHPALSEAARGHVAAHAAGVARGLYVGTSNPGPGLIRAVEASRLQIELARPVSAAALDSASAAASELAALRAEINEAPSEDFLGTWEDAMLWGVAALRSTETIRTSVDRQFDVGSCARRVAQAARMIADLTGDQSVMSTGERAIALARELDPDLPLIEQRGLDFSTPRSSAPARRSRRASMPSGASEAALSVRVHDAWRYLSDASAALGPERRGLRQKAATEFFNLASTTTVDLGGKRRAGHRGVSTISDPHGLASQLVVLKRVERRSAHREFEAITRLESWLEKSLGPRAWRVPEPLGVIDVDVDDGIFVMSRSPGMTLAQHAMDHFDGRAESPLRMFEVAVDALGEFHAAMSPLTEGTRRDDVTIAFQRALDSLFRADDTTSLAQSFLSVFRDVPYFAKKDAHAGNWIWSAALGGLILLDVEGDTSRPALLELSVLIEDLPLIALDEGGWEVRVRLGRRYLSAVAESGPATAELSDDDVRQLLEAGALYVATTGLARLQSRAWAISSLGVRFANIQRDHYSALIRHLVLDAGNDALRRAALRVASALDRY